MIKSAVDILSTNAPSSGFIESAYTSLKDATGSATAASKADSRLKVIGETLTAKVPRFEGPQSDKDTASYRAAAGDVANSNKPIQSRLAALEEMAKLAKKYYPNNFKDFSEAGFGSMMMDTVAYVGDILSFYLDYQANESFFDSAIEFKNVLKLSKQMGYKFRENPSSQGIATFFISIPASNVGAEV